MSNRAGLRSPASAASRMRVASVPLLDCACCSADNELHAKSIATCMSFTVSGLKCLTSAAINVPKGTLDFLTLPEGPLRVYPMPDQRTGLFAPLESGQLPPLWVKSGQSRHKKSGPLYLGKRTLAAAAEIETKMFRRDHAEARCFCPVRARAHGERQNRSDRRRPRRVRAFTS
jgi:hypothetical protein